MLIGLLFSRGIENDKNQIFITANGLNNVKMLLINGKIYNTLAVINLEEIKNWKNMKSTSQWVSVKFDEHKNTQKTDHFSFSFKTKNLNNLLSFSFYLHDSD